MAAEMHATSLRVSRPHTKAIRLMLISRSSLLKPSPLLRWVRTISPSSISTLRPRALRRCSMTSESVLLPAPESPVNQMVNPIFAMCISSSKFTIYSIESRALYPYSPLTQKAHASISLECLALHIGRDRHAQLLENGGSHIHQLQAGQFSPADSFVNGRIMLNHDTELRVVAIVRAGIVIKGVNGTVPDRANRAPEEIAEVDDQVGRNAIDLVVHFLGLKDGGAN